MEQISKMAIEVNKLIGSKLLAGKSIYLPQIGSLYITMTASQRKRVEFSSAQQGDSIVDVITARAKCSDVEGENIYQRYLEEVRQDTRLYIMGVGELRTKSFLTDENFSKQLNSTPVSPVVTPVIAPNTEQTKVVAPVPPIPAPTPAPEPEPIPEPASPIARQAVQPTTEKPKQHTPSAETVPTAPKHEKKRGGKKGIIIILLLLALAVVAYLLYDCIIKKQSAETTKSSSEQVVTTTTDTEEVTPEAEVADGLSSQEEIESNEPEEIETKEPEQSRTTSLRFRVVYGVFENRSNINRAIERINKQFGDGSARTYRYGAYTLVSIFEADNRDECQAFLMRNRSEYPDTWIHERKW